MNFADNIDYPPLLRRPVVLLPILALIYLALLRADVAHWPVLLKALSGFGLAVPQGPAAGALVAAALTALIGANAWIVLGLPSRWQVRAVWLELLVLLVVFFYSFDLSFAFIRRKIWILLSIGLVNTLLISACSIVLASVLALAGAIAKLSGNGVLVGVATFYTSLFRGIPLLMQIYLIYLGLPQVGIVVDAIPAGIAALALCYGAYMTEIFRAGIESIPIGQWEAARALGLKPADTLVRVILPQAMRVIIPPTGNQFIAMLKDSSLVSVVGVWELMYLARTEGQTEFRHMEMMLTASAIYWLFSIMLEMIQARIERHFGRAHGR
jgi:polar amino acid transport system permease protein